MSSTNNDLSCYSSRLTIDLSAIRSNYRLIASKVAPAECAAVIKANAYGLGAAEVAGALSDAGCRSFFVAQLQEANELPAYISRDAAIFILNGLDPGCEGICAARGFVPVLNSRSQVELWRAAARRHGGPLPAALQIDSGMSRLGLSPSETAALSSHEDFGREISLRLIMTHLACADEISCAANSAQLERFEHARSQFPGIPASIANSGGSVLPRGFHLDLVRPGVALFGVSPGSPIENLRPVVHLAARVLQIRDVPAGTGVGYGLDYIAPAPLRLATIGIGYADGWPRHLGGTGAAWHEGTRLPIVGRVSMDSLTIDISALPASAPLQEGDFVELVGPSQSLDDVATDAGTIAYEILTRLGPRHQRVFVGGKPSQLLDAGGSGREVGACRTGSGKSSRRSLTQKSPIRLRLRVCRQNGPDHEKVNLHNRSGNYFNEHCPGC